jgi:hypothetical protein
MEWNIHNIHLVVRREIEAHACEWIFRKRQFYKPIIQLCESIDTYVESPPRLRF